MKTNKEDFKGTYQEMVKEFNRTQYKIGFWSGFQSAVAIMLILTWLVRVVV